MNKSAVFAPVILCTSNINLLKYVLFILFYLKVTYPSLRVFKNVSKLYDVIIVKEVN